MEILITNALTSWAQNSNPIEFGKAVLLLYIAYRFFFKKTADKMTEQLEKLTDNVEQLNRTLVRVETSHSARISTLEEKVFKRGKPTKQSEED